MFQNIALEIHQSYFMILERFTSKLCIALPFQFWNVRFQAIHKNLGRRLNFISVIIIFRLVLCVSDKQYLNDKEPNALNSRWIVSRIITNNLFNLAYLKRAFYDIVRKRGSSPKIQSFYLQQIEMLSLWNISFRKFCYLNTCFRYFGVSDQPFGSRLNPFWSATFNLFKEKFCNRNLPFATVSANVFAYINM